MHRYKVRQAMLSVRRLFRAIFARPIQRSPTAIPRIKSMVGLQRVMQPTTWFLDKNGQQHILVALAFQIPTAWVTPEPLPMEQATLSHLQRSSLPAAQEMVLTFQEVEIWRSGQAEIGGGVLTIGGPRLVTGVRDHREIIGTCDHRPG